MFDLNILCIGQKTPVIHIPHNTNIWVNNINSNYRKRKKRYFQIAPVMNYMDGIWYELLRSEDEIAGTSICDYTTNGRTYPYWISSAEIKDDLCALVIDEEFFESFRAILKFMTEQSPINTIFFFCRFQSNDCETICGTLTCDDFISLLKQRKILTNVCYSIRNDQSNQG